MNINIKSYDNINDPHFSHEDEGDTVEEDSTDMEQVQNLIDTLALLATDSKSCDQFMTILTTVFMSLSTQKKNSFLNKIKDSVEETSKSVDFKNSSQIEDIFGNTIYKNGPTTFPMAQENDNIINKNTYREPEPYISTPMKTHPKPFQETIRLASGIQNPLIDIPRDPDDMNIREEVKNANSIVCIAAGSRFTFILGNKEIRMDKIDRLIEKWDTLGPPHKGNDFKRLNSKTCLTFLNKFREKLVKHCINEDSAALIFRRLIPNGMIQLIQRAEMKTKHLFSFQEIVQLVMNNRFSQGEVNAQSKAIYNWHLRKGQSVTTSSSSMNEIFFFFELAMAATVSFFFFWKQFVVECPTFIQVEFPHTSSPSSFAFLLDSALLQSLNSCFADGFF